MNNCGKLKIKIGFRIIFGHFKVLRGKEGVKIDTCIDAFDNTSLYTLGNSTMQFKCSH